MIEDAETIKGIQTKWGNTVKSVSYTEDNSMIIGELQDFKAIFEISEKHSVYARACDAEINKDKTEILLI